jgi:hypothetical protein
LAAVHASRARACSRGKAELLAPRSTEGTHSRASTRFETDGEGRFHVLLAVRAGVLSRERAELGFRFRDASGVLHFVEQSLPPEIAPLANDLGDVRFAPSVRLVTGVVIDEVGAPLERFDVLVVPQLTDGGGRRGGLPVDVHELDGGRFEAFGASTGARWSVRAHAPGHERSDPIAFESGARDVRVSLGAGGTLSGTIVFEPPAPAVNVRVVLRRSDGEALDAPGGELSCRVRSGSDGRFHFGVRRAGTYTLEVPREDRSHGRLALLSSVELTAGVECSDPRLSAIRLHDDDTAEPR